MFAFKHFVISAAEFGVYVIFVLQLVRGNWHYTFQQVSGTFVFHIVHVMHISNSIRQFNVFEGKLCQDTLKQEYIDALSQSGKIVKTVT